MKRHLWHWIISAIALWAAIGVLKGVDLPNPWNAIWIAPLLGLVNLAVGMVSSVLSFFFGCVNVLTLGAFGFILSFILYTVAVYYLGKTGGPLAPYMPVDSLPWAMALAAVMGLFSSLLNIFLPKPRKERK